MGMSPGCFGNDIDQALFYISPDRVISSKQAENEADVILLDDGMQHLPLKRDLDIVLIDASAEIGNGKLFPLGPLREPLQNLSRADIILYTKTNLNNSNAIREKITTLYQ